MRITLIFLFIILSNTVNAQIKFEDLKQKISAYETVKEFDSLVSVKSIQKMNAFLVYYEFQRNIDSGYKHR